MILGLPLVAFGRWGRRSVVEGVVEKKRGDDIQGPCFAKPLCLVARERRSKSSRLREH